MKNMLQKTALSLAAAALLGAATVAQAADITGSPPSALKTPNMGPSAGQDAMPVMVGGGAMYPSKNIIQNATNSKDHTTLVAAIKAAGLVEPLEGKGPFTVFAPTNEAFAKLPAGTVDGLLKPENKEALKALLSYHVVPGSYNATQMLQMAQAAGGTAKLKTLAGTDLMIKDVGGKPEVIDARGDKSMISTPDVMQSNGVIQVIDTVMMPGA